jgi:hypothetical protein
MRIMSASEVAVFMKEHDIRSRAFRIEGSYPRLPDIPGELYDVTVSEALDYVLITFPGYWHPFYKLSVLLKTTNGILGPPTTVEISRLQCAVNSASPQRDERPALPLAIGAGVRRTSFRAGVSPAEVQRLSRRTVTTTTADPLWISCSGDGMRQRHARRRQDGLDLRTI